MIDYQQALQIITDSVSAVPPEHASLSASTGCATATDIISGTAVPPFANTAMDGYALRSVDTADASESNPVEMQVAGTTTAGELPPETAVTNACWEIMTGAPMPPGCDAVIPVENVECTRGADGVPLRIRFTRPVQPGQHVRKAGEDIARGQMLLPAGQPIYPHAVMGIGAIGRAKISVRRMPRVAIITTGNELQDTEKPLQGGLIRDANGPYLAAFMAHTGIRLVVQESVLDDPSTLRASMESAAEVADIILTTGGVSAGRMDFVPSVVTEIGGEILFHKVAMRPGKPLLFARLPAGQLIFGLPGNPIAVAVGLRFYVVPALHAMQGLAAERFHPAVSLDAVHKRPGQRFFAKAVAKVDETGRMTVQILPGQESFKISPLIQANCWAILPEGKETVAAGDLIEIAPLYPTGFLQPPG